MISFVMLVYTIVSYHHIHFSSLYSHRHVLVKYFHSDSHSIKYHFISLIVNYELENHDII
jgi:hypothetical protein